MNARPAPEDAAPYSNKYIGLVEGDDCVASMTAQLDEATAFFGGISEETSLHRYAPEKWSIRQVLGHISDTERIFTYRALWFARDLGSPLPGFEQDVAVAAGRADSLPWAAHVEEFRHIRVASIDFFRNLPPEAWTRRGTASGFSFTVLAFGFMVPGHVTHHIQLLRERYL
jgi:hypothetical protein